MRAAMRSGEEAARRGEQVVLPCDYYTRYREREYRERIEDSQCLIQNPISLELRGGRTSNILGRRRAGEGGVAESDRIQCQEVS